MSARTNIKSFEASYESKHLSSPILEATVVAEKTAQGWKVATKASHVENVKLNDAPISNMEKVELIVENQMQSAHEAMWHIQASHFPVVLIQEAKSFYQGNLSDFDLSAGIINYLDLKLQSQAEAWKLLNI